MVYRVQVGTGPRVQCRVQSDGMQQRIVELSSIVEIDRLFWVILVAPVDHEVSFFRQCGPLPIYNTTYPTTQYDLSVLSLLLFYFKDTNGKRNPMRLLRSVLLIRIKSHKTPSTLSSTRSLCVTLGRGSPLGPEYFILAEKQDNYKHAH